MRGEYSRRMIYLSVYREGVKQRSAGYVGLLCRGESCEIQIFCRCEECIMPMVPFFLFRDGSLVEGTALQVKEGVAVGTFQSDCRNILNSGKTVEELEEIYLEGAPEGICGGRIDGGIPTGCCFVEPVAPEPQMEEAVLTENKEKKEVWQFVDFLEYLPELRLSFGGIRKQCCKVMLEDLEHLPKDWERIKENQFLLHGFYEYQHLMLGRLFQGRRTRYVLGIPGEWNYREQYMAEHFGFPEFVSAEQGGGKRNPFGYWCRTLE